jgi:hypothetical protein
MIATDYSQLDKKHLPCSGYIMPAYNLSGLVECEACGATGLETGTCNDCSGFGWRLTRLSADP